MRLSRIQKWLRQRVITARDGRTETSEFVDRRADHRGDASRIRFTQCTSPQRQGHPRTSHFQAPSPPTRIASPGGSRSGMSAVDAPTPTLTSRNSRRRRLHQRVSPRNPQMLSTMPFNRVTSIPSRAQSVTVRKAVTPPRPPTARPPEGASPRPHRAASSEGGRPRGSGSPTGGRLAASTPRWRHAAVPPPYLIA